MSFVDGLTPEWLIREHGCELHNRARNPRSDGNLGCSSEHHLNTIKRSSGAQNENRVDSIARTRSTKTLLSLLSLLSHFPKLDVAGRVPSPAPKSTLSGPDRSRAPCAEARRRASRHACENCQAGVQGRFRRTREMHPAQLTPDLLPV